MSTIEKNERFELAFRFATETNENIFLTGKAGTGKTTFLKYLKENIAKNMVVAAPTGVAAINAGGVTIHSLFQLPLRPFIPTVQYRQEFLSNQKYGGNKQRLLQTMELLVIDEISMVRCDVMEAIDAILRSVRRRYDVPFGGVQLLCIGDLYQLQPVAPPQEWSILSEFYASPYFFDSPAVKEQQPILIELNKIYRQKEQSFVDLLNKVRTNNMNTDDFEDLNMRYNPNFYPDKEEKYIRLTTHNRQADLLNQQELNKLNTGSFTYKATIEGDFDERIYPVEYELFLKEGSQVMFLKNDVFKKYYNGKIGVVKSLEADKIIVDCDGELLNVPLETWENVRYNLDKKTGALQQDVIGTFEQYPLRLAWAITIHKSQGLTFEKVMIDAGEAFSSGQVYVALSRCTSLAGIVLLTKIPPVAITSNISVDEGTKRLSPKGSLAERFAGARALFVQNTLEQLFDFSAIYKRYSHMQQLVNTHAAHLPENAFELSQSMLKSIEAIYKTGHLFNTKIVEYLRQNGLIEENQTLQERLMAAADHFLPLLQSKMQELSKLPITTEHKDAADAINPVLTDLYLNLHQKHYLMAYCKNAFAVVDYLTHKLKYEQPKTLISIYALGQNSVAPVGNMPNVELYNTLKRWRDMVCNDEGLTVYMVANQATLQELATYLPHTKAQLLNITGFGKAKVDKYGDDVLEAISSYCEQYSIESNMENFAAVSKKKPKAEKPAATKIDTKKVSFDLYKEGKTIADIATSRNMSAVTIEGHLSHYVATSQIELSDFVTASEKDTIIEAVAVHGTSSLKLIFEHIEGKLSYGKIRMVVAYLTREMG